MGISVFLVDDHDLILVAYRALLDKHDGIDVVGEAADGIEAIEKIESIKPDVVVMDITMPILNGIDATEQIVASNPQIKVLVLSYHNNTEFIASAMQAGASGYLTKDTAQEEMISAIESVMNGDFFMGSNVSVNAKHDLKKYLERTPINRLSKREKQVIQLIAEGKTHKEAADIMNIDHRTVDTYKWRAMSKLDIDTLPDLIKFALQHGLTAID